MTPHIVWRVDMHGPKPVLIRLRRPDGTLDVSFKVGGYVLIRGSLRRKWSDRKVNVPASDLFPEYQEALAEMRARRHARQQALAGQPIT